MKQINNLLAILLFTIFFISCGFDAPVQSAEAEKAPAVRDEFFLAQGTITEVRPEEKILHVKIDGGPEVTFYVNEATLINLGGQKESFDDLAAGDMVEIKYAYNEDYRKVAQAIFVKGRPAVGAAASGEPESPAEKTQDLRLQKGDGKN